MPGKITEEEREGYLKSAIPITPETLNGEWILVSSKSACISEVYRLFHPNSILRGAYFDIASCDNVRHKVILTDRTMQTKIISHGFKVAKEELLIGADYDQITNGELVGKCKERTFFNEDRTALITDSEVRV